MRNAAAVNFRTLLAESGRMAITQADIDALNAAIASGERQVVLGGQSITYRSIADLITARNDLQSQLTAQAVADGVVKRRPKQWYAYQNGRGY